MPNQTQGGRFERQQDIDLSPAAALTATANGTGFETGDKGTLRLTQNVTAASGTTPSLTTAVQTSKDDGATDAYRTIASFTAKTGTGSERKCFSGLDHWIRLSHTISGTTPSFTVTYTGSAV
jgi:Tfp pilus assembly protein PilW